ncbi:ABC transporter ATP-binding protein [Mobilicoccus pelagius]|uniref:Peptide ABC transporter ATP-binding protein n=1 Tax=Mobilicoccus pelagius NBRC 104925 TaxID=1089455 RepID=H5URF8_9MICO|nr:ABC transporter ATP-binding protein [Mobilicoccus pelagius]GAB48316.1 peptide ABC transporter ATP-binding protein [Mobilicoccus pelagius NBRC 104925]
MPDPAPTASPALTVEGLSVAFRSGRGEVRAVDDVSLGVDGGRVLGVVGESGSGKSTLALATMGLLPDTARVDGHVRVGGIDMVTADEPQRERVRGGDIAMVFQDATAALNPFRTVGAQIAAAHRLRHGVSRRAAHARAVETLALVGMSNPRAQADQYPHELSGGMRQRAMIATAIVNEPRVLIADEPTTALDVTVQAQVLDVLNDLVRQMHMAMVLITHDLGVVAQTADDVLVMYAGQVAEVGGTTDLFARPAHPYTRGLHAATPDMDAPPARLAAIPGVPASGADRPSGCPFHPRCPLQPTVGEACLVRRPALTPRPGVAPHLAACHATQEPA